MSRLSFPAALADSSNAVGRYWHFAPIVALLIISLYIAFIVTTDNTNLGTTNGLWKTPSVSAWEHGGSVPPDSGGFLYYPSYGLIARLIPDRLVQYGTESPVVTFRKMAILNAIFGGAASGLVVLLALRFSNSLAVAFLVAAAHAGGGFVLLNSVNSEDIIPAYTFFLGATVCFFEFLHRAQPWLLHAATLLFALATLFHWTVMIPGLAAFGAVLVIIMMREKSYIPLGAVWLFLFSCALQILVLLYFPRWHIPVWAVLIPAKAGASGWLGLNAEKVRLAVLGIGNYFSGANNSANYRTALEGGQLGTLTLSWLYFLTTMGAAVAVLFARRTALASKCLAAFALVLLGVGEAGALYAQPQDPQLQIQPLFATVAGLILLARPGSPSPTPLRRVMTGLFLAVALANGFSNAASLRRGSVGGDRRSLAAVQELGALFPKDDTAVLSQGFEGWTTWQFVIQWHGDRVHFDQKNIALSDVFLSNRGISGADAATLMKRRIDGAFAAGLRVVSAALWTETPQQFCASMNAVADENRVLVYDSILRASYHTGRVWKTRLGPFVEILSAEGAHAGTRGTER